MAAFVVVALALAVLSVAAAVLAVLQLKTALSALFGAVREAGAGLAPLAAELAEEAAVTGAELEALGERPSPSTAV